ncbi:MAG: glycosyltransferase, partial [bacterium]|nr:glycosyltransferase [bacterium]
MTKVSIILPTYNGAKYIKKSIDSCLDQTYQDIELVIVDDGSTDKTPEIVESYLPVGKAGNDAGIKYIKHSKNLGLSQTLNTGFENSTGEYLTWTSDDNYYAQNAIKAMADFLDANPNTDFVYANYYCIDESGKVFLSSKVESPENLKYRNCIGACFLYRRNVYETIGKYDSLLPLVEDYDYWMRVSKQFKMQNINESLYYYRLHPDSLIRRYGDNKVRTDAHKIRDKHFYPYTMTKEYSGIPVEKKLNILVVSNLYPPYYIGGYELVCKDVVDSLRNKGHNVSILTSNYGVENHKTDKNPAERDYSVSSKSASGRADKYPTTKITGRSPLERDVPDACSTIENDVYRELTHYFDYQKKAMSFKETLTRETRESGILKKLVCEFKPDVLFLFNMGALTKSLLKTMESFDVPVVYDISDYWLAGDKMVDNWLNYWQTPVKNKLASFMKMKFLGLITQPDLKEYFKSIFSVDLYSLNFNYTYFTSNFLKFQYGELGFPCSSAPVFYRGIDTKKFLMSQNKSSNVPLKLLYSGGLHPDKGPHTAIEAVNILTEKGYEVTLSIAGGVRDKEYVDSLYKTVEQQKLPVKFLG